MQPATEMQLSHTWSLHYSSTYCVPFKFVSYLNRREKHFSLFYVYIQDHGIKKDVLDDQVLVLAVIATTYLNPLCKCIYSILEVAYCLYFLFS